jgi:acyl carrier protein
MPDDTALVTRDELTAMVRRVIAEVLVIPADQVRDDSAIVADLGAESIDFLDLLFRLEEVLGRKVPIERWQRFLEERLPGASYATAITTTVVADFAEQEWRRAAA